MSSTTASTRSPRRRPRRRPTHSGRGWISQARWTRAQSNKLLLEAGISYYNQPYEQDCKSTVGPTDLPHLEAATGLLTIACGYTIPPYSGTTEDYSTMASASYVTGSHAIKAGMTDGWGTNSRTFAPNANIDTLITFGGAPFEAVVYNSPATAIQKVKSDFGSYIQDTWTMKRITLNYGARFDHFNAMVPAESAPALDVDRRAQLRRDRQRAELERLVGPSRRRVRSVRRRQDRREGDRRQVCRVAGDGLRGDLQRHDRRDADAQLGGPGQERHHHRRQRQHRDQRGHRRHIQFRPDNRAPGSGARASL